jgi:tetratricopeptide (TPR) repeat protein
MATSEIEKLERRYAENPHGLTFAPLAEVHRKNGDVARALELLSAGLELHPNYIPASIVLGRCHQDLGDFPSAEAAFAHVLRLDDENVIALKSLADINERLERFGEAQNWLRRLVSVDRSNDEARDQLRRLETKERSVEVALEPAVASSPGLEVIDLGPKPAVESPAEGPKVADLLPVELAALELSRASAEMARRLGAAPQIAEPASAIAPAPDVAADRPVKSPVATSAPDPEEAAPAKTVKPVAGLISAEFEPPLEAIGGLGVETSEEVVLEVSGNSEFRVPDASDDLKNAFRAAAEPERGVARSEADAAQTIGLPATRRSYLARETKGRSVASFFHTLLAARPPADTGSAQAGAGSQVDRGAPTPASHNAASLSSLAGDDNLPVPPGPAAEQEAGEAVSFDDFFGSEPEGSTPLRQRADPGKDDLDEFQSWLQNLKR